MYQHHNVDIYLVKLTGEFCTDLWLWTVFVVFFVGLDVLICLTGYQGDSSAHIFNYYQASYQTKSPEKENVLLGRDKVNTFY